MRTALFLLLLLAVAAVPGSILPQRGIDESKVAIYLQDHRTAGPFLDRIGAFSVYSSVWFSAIYLLLFISLIGCVLPRAKHHWQALRSQPPRTPARLTRMSGFQSTEVVGDPAALLASARAALASAATSMRVVEMP